jgi:hypothetical protein
MLYRQQQAGKTTVEKQVRAAPKIVKPGSSQSQNRDTKTLQNLKNAIRQTGSRESIADYLLATGRA